MTASGSFEAQGRSASSSGPAPRPGILLPRGRQRAFAPRTRRDARGRGAASPETVAPRRAATTTILRREDDLRYICVP